MSDDVPEGYQPFVLDSPFLKHIRPVYQPHSDSRHSLGLRVAPYHCNELGIVHGGLLMTLADVALGNISDRPGGTPPCVTVSMSCEFSDGAREGDWIEASVDVEARQFLALRQLLPLRERRAHRTRQWRLQGSQTALSQVGGTWLRRDI